jgi:AraC-like DNA-binding protein
MESLDTSWRSALMLSMVLPMVVVSIALSIRDVETKSNRFLAVFILLFGLNLVPQIIGFSGFYQAFPWLTFAPFNNELWLGPLLLAHTCHLLKVETTKRFGWFFVPGILQSSYYCIAFISMPDYHDKWTFNDAFHEPYIVPFELVTTILLTLFCVWSSWQLITQYQVKLIHVQSSIDSFDTRWLKRAIELYASLVTLWIMFEVYHQVIQPMTNIDQFGFYLIFAIIVLWSGIQALSHIREPYPKVEWLEAVNQELKPDEPDDEQLLADWALRIEQGMTESQWFRRAKLSVSDVAQELGTNETYVSRALNSHWHKNFNQLVNEARVKFAQALMRENRNRALLDIAYDSGFASKASFNRWFKQCTGRSPSAWLEDLGELKEIA